MFLKFGAYFILFRELLDEPQDTEFKGTIINYKESKEFKELQDNKCLSDAEQNPEIRLTEMMRITQDLTAKFNEEAEIFKIAQDERNIELKSKQSNKNTEGTLYKEIDQVEDRPGINNINRLIKMGILKS